MKKRTKNNKIMNFTKLFSFGTAPLMLFLLLAPSLFIIHLFFFLVLFFTFNWVLDVALIMFMIYLIWYSRKNGIIKVNLYQDHIEVIHFFWFKSVYEYTDVKVMNEFKQGFLPYEVIVVKLKQNEYKKKKIHFYCPEDKRIELDKFFETKGLRIRPQP